MLDKINSMDNLRYPEKGETALIWEFAVYGPAMDSNGIEDYEGLFLLTNDKGEGLCSPVGFLPSVNANGKNKELAVDFVRFLMSEEIQSSTELLFNPLSKKASAGMAGLLLENVRADGYEPESFDLEKNIGLFNGLADYMKVTHYSDSFVSGFVWEELERYFNGETTSEEAAKNLQSRLNTYLKE
jgi:multiple sugar transport system substrate-binding protein